MKQSKLHHYVPVFLTKNFTNENGQIIIYDKFEDKIFESNPKNIFAEKFRNTFVNEDGKKDDRVEKLYADIDSHYSTIINNIRETGNLDNGNLKWLLSFAYIIKWRVPQYDESFSNLKQKLSVDDLGIGIKDINGERLDVTMEDIFDKDIYQEIKRVLLSMQPIRFKDDFKKIFLNSFLISSTFPALIGDCPFNEAAVSSGEIFEDFVFPFTENLTLIYSQRINKFELQNFLLHGDTKKSDNFIKNFSIARDISTLSLAGRFVGCSDENYLKYLIINFKELLQSDRISKTLNNAVFNRLYNYKDYI